MHIGDIDIFHVFVSVFNVNCFFIHSNPKWKTIYSS